MHEAVKVFGQMLKCPVCDSIFSICHSCYRGQKYCTEPCRIAARKLQARLATARYQSLDSGRKKHRLRQNAYRRRQLKNVTHESSRVSEIKLEPPTGVATHELDRRLWAARHCVVCRWKIDFFSNEFTASPATDRQRKRRKRRNDQHRKGGRGPPTIPR